jgi:hypothetical protein
VFLHHWAFSKSNQKSMTEEEIEASINTTALGNKVDK